MPPPGRAFRRQAAVLWPKAGYDPDGLPMVGPPEPISVRWTRKRRNALSATGEPIPIDATLTVGKVIAVGSELWLGKLEDWYGTGSGAIDTEVMRVISYDEIPDKKNRFKRKTISLQFAKTTPST